MASAADRAARRADLILALLIVFSSGLCSLLYQSVWLRDLRLVFGASTPSNAAVTAIFMGGLGFGGLYFGRRVERTARPLELYWKLELAVALLAAVSPLLTDVIRSIYTALGGTTSLGQGVRTLAHLLLATLVLGPSVFAMGGTMPALARGIVSDDDNNRSTVSWLYGINTLGAVIGVFVPAFVLVELTGFRDVLFIGVVLNILLAVVARRFSRRLHARETVALADDSATTTAPPSTATTTAPTTTTAAHTVPGALLWAAAFVVGAAFMVLELAWYRVASPILGGSTYTFATILSVALFGIGVGGALYARRSGRAEARATTVGDFALSCLAMGAVALVPYALGDDFSRFTAALNAVGATSFFATACGWFVVTAILVLPAALLSGFQFPMLVGLVGHGRDGVGRDLGTVYLFNTLGSIVGSLAGGFVFVPTLGAAATWIGATAALQLLGVMLLLVARDARRAVGGVAFVVVGVGLALMPGPDVIWRTQGVGSAHNKQVRLNAFELESTLRQARSTVVAIEDGRESTVATIAGDGLAFVVNGKSDGHSIGDATTQIGLGLVPAMLHPAPRDAFIVGLGTGETAGWLAALQGIERVDVAEFEPDVYDFAQLCSVVNHDVLHHDKVDVILGDGREILQSTKRRYDLIVSEPSNPYRAGLSGFYAVDFYRAARDRLRTGGLYAQWLQAYAVDDEAIVVAMRSLREVFAVVEVWHLQGNDLLLIGSDSPIVLDSARLATRLKDPVAVRAFDRFFGRPSPEGLAAWFVAGTDVVDAVSSGARMHTDDEPVLEFLFARGLGRSPAGNVILRLRAQAMRRGTDLPHVDGAFSPGLARALRAHAYVRNAADVEVTPALAEHPGVALLAGNPDDDTITTALAEADDNTRLRWLLRALTPTSALPEAWEPTRAGLEDGTFATEAKLLRVLATLRSTPREQHSALLVSSWSLMQQEPFVDAVVGQRIFERIADVAVDDREGWLSRLSTPLPVYRFERLRLPLLDRLMADTDGGYAHASCGAWFLSRAGRLPWTRESIARQATCAERVAPELRAQAEADAALFMAQTPPDLLSGR